MGRMSDLHIEKQESGMLDDHPDQSFGSDDTQFVTFGDGGWIPLKQHMVDGDGLSTEILANEILLHFQGKTFRPEDQIEAWTEANQNALELRNLIQALLDRHRTVLYQP